MRKNWCRFENLKFEKSGAAITERAKIMLTEVDAKILEREGRIRAAAEKAGMSSAADVLLHLETIRAGSGEGDFNMNVGIAAQVRGEVDALRKDRDERDNLRLIVDNLDPQHRFMLSFDELSYFGF